MDMERRVEALLNDFIRMGPPGCGLVIARDGRTICRMCAGYADVEAGVPLRGDTLVRLYSNSKVFTSVALMTLYEQGRFLLDEPVAKYLPEFADAKVGFFTGNGVYTVRPAARPMRIRDLLCMTSGLPYDAGITGGRFSLTHGGLADALDDLEARGGYTVREFTKRIAEVPLLFDPGASWSYGYSHDVVGALIEVLADMEFEDYLRKAILDPLGLKDTSFFIRDDRRDRLSRMYGAKTAAGDNPPVTDRDAGYEAAHRFKSGGGGMLSTLDDLSRFAAALAMGGALDGVRVIGRKTLDLMRQNHLDEAQLRAFRAAHENGWEFLAGYGYGLGVRTLMSRQAAGANGTSGEFGWAGAAGTYLLADPEERFSVAYVQQVLPNPYEGYCHPRLRAVAYSLIDEAPGEARRAFPQ